MLMLCTSLPVSERKGRKHSFRCFREEKRQHVSKKWLAGTDIHRGDTDTVTVRTVISVDIGSCALYRYAAIHHFERWPQTTWFGVSPPLVPSRVRGLG